MYRRPPGLIGAGGLAATGMPNAFLYVGISAVLFLIGLFLYRIAYLSKRDRR